MWESVFLSEIYVPGSTFLIKVEVRFMPPQFLTERVPDIAAA